MPTPTSTVQPTRLNRLARLLVAFVIAAGGLIGVTAASAVPAHASCATPMLQGNWANIDPSTRSMTKVNVGFFCGDVRLCDTNGHCTGGESYFTLRGFGKCSPTDCDWGSRRASDMGDGWQRAVYGYSWATKYLWVKTYVYSGITYLRVYTYTDYTAADGRTDRSTDEWMRK